MGAELGLAVLGEDLHTWGEGRSVGAGGSRYAHVCASMNVWTPCSLITPPSSPPQCPVHQADPYLPHTPSRKPAGAQPATH